MYKDYFGVWNGREMESKSSQRKIVHTDSSGVPFFRDRGKLLDINPMGQKNCFRMMRRRTKTRTQSRQAVKYNCFNEIHVLDLVAGLHRDSGTRAQ